MLTVPATAAKTKPSVASMRSNLPRRAPSTAPNSHLTPSRARARQQEHRDQSAECQENVVTRDPRGGQTNYKTVTGDRQRDSALFVFSAGARRLRNPKQRGSSLVRRRVGVHDDENLYPRLPFGSDL